MSKRINKLLVLIGVSFLICTEMTGAVLADGVGNRLSIGKGSVARATVKVSVTIPVLVYNKTTVGWMLVLNTTEATGVDFKKFETVSFLHSGESYIYGEEMRLRAIEMKCNFGQVTAEYFLAHQNNIPEELRKHVLLFPGTVWQDKLGVRYAPHLSWFFDRWYLGFGRLIEIWNDDFRLLSLHK